MIMRYQKSFLTRSSYRFTSKLNMTSLKQLPDIVDDNHRPNSSISIDSRLSDNYERMISKLFNAFQDGDRTGNEVRKNFWIK